MNRNKLTIKDLVSIGVFAVIYFICMFAVGMMGVIPILFLVYPAAYALIGGPIVMLFMAKVNKPFGLLIFGMIPSCIMFLFGHTFVVPLLSLLFFLIAEGIRRIGKYQSGSATMLSYAVFSLWPCNSLMQMLLLKERYMEMVIKEMGGNYGNAIEKLITVQNMAIVYVCTFLFGLFGAFLGRKLLKKHFEKAGIV